MARQSKTQKSTLTFSKISDENKQYNEKHLFKFSNGETLNIHVRFRPSIIENLLEEFGQHLNFYETEKGKPLSDKFRINFLHFLIIKYFSDLKKLFSNDSKKLLSQFETMIDTLYFKELIEEGFLKEEIKKVWDKAVDVTAGYMFMEKLNRDMKNKLNKLELDNRDVIEKAFSTFNDRNKNKQIPEA